VAKKSADWKRKITCIIEAARYKLSKNERESEEEKSSLTIGLRQLRTEGVKKRAASGGSLSD